MNDPDPNAPVAPLSRGRRAFVVMLLVIIVAVDYASIHKSVMVDQWIRLIIMLGVALGLNRWLGPAALPLSWGQVRLSMRWVGKVVLFGALIGVAIVLALLAAARLGGLRWTVQTANIHHLDQFWPWFVLAVIWAPLIEELVYRGIVQARLRQLTGRWVAIALSGLLFWSYHWVSFEHVTSPHHLGAGLLLAWSYDRTRSLLAPTLLHALGNFVLGVADLVYLVAPDVVHQAYGWS